VSFIRLVADSETVSLLCNVAISEAWRRDAGAADWSCCRPGWTEHASYQSVRVTGILSWYMSAFSSWLLWFVYIRVGSTEFVKYTRNAYISGVDSIGLRAGGGWSRPSPKRRG